MRRRAPHRRGFSLIEGVLSSVIIGVMLVAAVQVAAASRVLQFKTAEQARGTLLAETLITEALSRPYEDPVAPTFGREAGETGTTRAALDDLDDYHGWTESPPQEADGTPMPGLAGWSRAVEVARANRSLLSLLSGTETGARRVTVTVQRNGVSVARLVAVRTTGR